MITEKDRIALKTILGGHYTAGVLEILKQKHIVNKQQEPYSPKYIRMIYQGLRENLAIEEAIYELARKRKNRHKNYTLLKSQL